MSASTTPSPGTIVTDIRLSRGVRSGVYASRSYSPGEVIEDAPVISIPHEDVAVLAATDLAPYLETWPSDECGCVLPIGYAALYRESAAPNTRVVPRPADHRLRVIACLAINEDEEITVPRRRP